MIKEILKKEISGWLCRDVTDSEYRSVCDYIVDYINDNGIVDLSELSNVIIAWKEENCVRCPYCDCWCLPEELDCSLDEGYGSDLRFCSYPCAIEYREEAEWEEEDRKELQSRWNER